MILQSIENHIEKRVSKWVVSWKIFSNQKKKGIGVWSMGGAYYLEACRVVYDLEMNWLSTIALKLSFQKRAQNYLCIRSAHQILNIAYLNCFWHCKKKQVIVDEYPLCPRDLGTKSTFKSYVRLIQKKWQNPLYPVQPAQLWCKQMKVTFGWEAHRGWFTNTTTRFKCILLTYCASEPKPCITSISIWI